MATAYKDNMAFTLINRFDGGIVNDPRDIRENTCRMATNFDVFTPPTPLARRLAYALFRL